MPGRLTAAAPPGDVRLHVVELGAGPPVVMLHGLLVGNLATWYLTAAPALARTHRVLLYDLRGHGRSERPPTGYDPDTMADDLDALLRDRVPEGPVALVGHSYGAVVALCWAARHPERAARLVLVEAPVAAADTEALTAFLAQPPEAMAAALPEPLRLDLARGGRRSRRLLESLVALATGTTVLDDVRRDVDAAWLDDVRCPIVAVYGTRSACRPAAERLLADRPGVRLALLEGGHYLPLEAPAALTATLVEALGG